MTKTKVKGSFASSPARRYAVDNHNPPDSSNFMPFVRIENKRKRAPRGMVKPRQQGFVSSPLQDVLADSASEFETSSSSHDERDDNDDDDNDQDVDDDDGGDGDMRRQSDSPEGDSAHDKGMAMDASFRHGSVRLKVKPSKFKESPSMPPVEKSSKTKENSESFFGRDVGSFITPAEKYYKKRSAMKSNEPSRPALSRDHIGQMNPSRQQLFTSTPQANRNELQNALKVVKKIMKMEAAEPFNVPVDPVALGIPDYFIIIKHPMDLGTICQNLERGGKYRNSRDVYEDVQLVWANCRNYNRKGDPILDLLARVKKNFMKYWTAAGLYTEKTPAFLGPSMGENKARDARSHFDELEHRFHERQDDPNVSSDDADATFDQRKALKFSTYASDGDKMKKKHDDRQHTPIKEHSGQIARSSEGREHEIVQKLDGWEKSVDKNLIQHKKTADLQSTAGKSKRVSGTGHHKPDCTCVVCTGVRRKLAREGKLGNSTEGGLGSTGAQEKVLVRLKTEGHAKADKGKAGYRIKIGEANKEKKTRLIVRDVSMSEVANRDNSSSGPQGEANATSDVVEEEDKGTLELNETGQDEIMGLGDVGTEVHSDSHVHEASEEDKKLSTEEAETSKENAMRSEQTPDDGAKEGLGEEMDDREDGAQTDEQFGDAETDGQEGGVRYYRASYEMPLRKVNPSILQMGQRLFGTGSLWSRGRPLGRKPECFSENPMYTTVSSLLSNRSTVLNG